MLKGITLNPLAGVAGVAAFSVAGLLSTLLFGVSATDSASFLRALSSSGLAYSSRQWFPPGAPHGQIR